MLNKFKNEYAFQYFTDIASNTFLYFYKNFANFANLFIKFFKINISVYIYIYIYIYRLSKLIVYIVEFTHLFPDEKYVILVHHIHLNYVEGKLLVGREKNYLIF